MFITYRIHVVSWTTHDQTPEPIDAISFVGEHFEDESEEDIVNYYLRTFFGGGSQSLTINIEELEKREHPL